MTRPRGRFITLEGGEAAGKSTQARLLAAELRRYGIEAVVTREPGGAPGAEAIRAMLLAPDAAWPPLAETLLHFAARSDHLAHTILPALDAGDWVICDRFHDSTTVYQGYGQGADRAVIASLVQMLPLLPDLTVVIDVPVPISEERLRLRGGEMDRYERLGAAFFQRIRDGFLAIAAEEPNRCSVVPGDRVVSEVARDIVGLVRTRFSLNADGRTLSR